MIPLFHSRFRFHFAAGALVLFGGGPLKAADPADAARPAPVVPAATTIPAEFKDSDNGARILHLSTVLNDASGVIYLRSCSSAPKRMRSRAMNSGPRAARPSGTITNTGRRPANNSSKAKTSAAAASPGTRSRRPSARLAPRPPPS